MRFLTTALLVLVCIRGAGGQERGQYDPTNSYSVFAAYSNDSSHMILGDSENRRLLAVGMDYSRRLGGHSIYSWRYQIEVIPLELLQDPKMTLTDAYTLNENGVAMGLTGSGFQTSSFQQRDCRSESGSGTLYAAGNNGQAIPIGTYSYASICSNPWTYGFGVSPLGQKVNFLPRGRMQPYIATNAGFVAFTGTVPSNHATMFNFSFEFGGGIQWYVRPGRAWSLDYRCHHISNAGRGLSNPGVDNGTFRLAYTFWR